MANVCCSIEMEPRTLNQGQLNHARELAADVAQKLEPREASAIFIEGLISGVEVEEVQLTDKEKKAEANKKAQITETACQCSINNIESPNHDNILNNCKEPVTAPF